MHFALFSPSWRHGQTGAGSRGGAEPLSHQLKRPQSSAEAQTHSFTWGGGHPLYSLNTGQRGLPRPLSCGGHTFSQLKQRGEGSGPRRAAGEGGGWRVGSAASSPRGPPGASGCGQGLPPAPGAIPVPSNGPAWAPAQPAETRLRLLSATLHSSGPSVCDRAAPRRGPQPPTPALSPPLRDRADARGKNAHAPPACAEKLRKGRAARPHCACAAVTGGTGRAPCPGGHGAARREGAVAAGGGGAAGRPPALPRHGPQPRCGGGAAGGGGGRQCPRDGGWRKLLRAGAGGGARTTSHTARRVRRAF